MKVVFYLSDNGRSPVETELAKLDRANRSKVFSLMKILENQGLNMQEPHVKSLGKGLLELRISIHPGQYRVVYFVFERDTAVMLHSFKKKTQKTPKKDLDLAMKRMKNWKQRNES